MTRKILLIDEDLNFLEALAYLLRHQGYDTAFAYDGQLGLQKAESRDVALIVTDLALPDLGGLELIKRLRARTRSRLKPIFVVTAHSDQMLAAAAAGANQVFGKPLSFDGLLRSIQRAAGSSSQTRPEPPLARAAEY